MVKVVLTLFVVWYAIAVQAQPFSAISDPVLRTELQFKMGRHLVVIKPLQQHNEAHQWTTFDSITNVTVTKRLVTPYVKRIVRQLYFSGGQTIIRVDQYFAGKQLHINAYVFDVYGNIIFRKDITDSVSPSYRLFASPYFVVQSPNKQVISLVQAMVVKGEQIKVSSIVFDNQLQINSTRNYTVPFDSELMDMYMPLVNDDATVLLFVADKPQSYRLNSGVTCYLLAPDKKEKEQIHFEFERKKLKGLNFRLTDDSLKIYAFFSLDPRKKEIAGQLQTGFHLNSFIKSPVKAVWYNNNGVTRAISPPN